MVASAEYALRALVEGEHDQMLAAIAGFLVVALAALGRGVDEAGAYVVEVDPKLMGTMLEGFEKYVTAAEAGQGGAAGGSPQPPVVLRLVPRA